MTDDDVRMGPGRVNGKGMCGEGAVRRQDRHRVAARPDGEHAPGRCVRAEILRQPGLSHSEDSTVRAVQPNNRAWHCRARQTNADHRMGVLIFRCAVDQYSGVGAFAHDQQVHVPVVIPVGRCQAGNVAGGSIPGETRSGAGVGERVVAQVQVQSGGRIVKADDEVEHAVAVEVCRRCRAGVAWQRRQFAGGVENIGVGEVVVVNNNKGNLELEQKESLADVEEIVTYRDNEEVKVSYEHLFPDAIAAAKKNGTYDDSKIMENN